MDEKELNQRDSTTVADDNDVVAETAVGEENEVPSTGDIVVDQIQDLPGDEEQERVGTADNSTSTEQDGAADQQQQEEGEEKEQQQQEEEEKEEEDERNQSAAAAKTNTAQSKLHKQQSILDKDSKHRKVEIKGTTNTIIRLDHTCETGKTIGSRLNHAYMGGYRHKKNGTIYLHACTQTARPELLRQLRAGQRYHRETQTIHLRNRPSQTTKESSTQMARNDLHLNTVDDRAMFAYQTKGRYISADEYVDRRVQAVIRIQSFYRAIKARRYAKLVKYQKWQYESGLTEKKEEREAFLRQLRLKAERARTHPRTRRDFLMLYSSLETWRQTETERIKKECGSDEKLRLQKLAELLDEEVVLLQKIDRLHLVADSENSEDAVRHLLDRMTQSKTWKNQNIKGPVALENPMTIRARELKDLYDALDRSYTETKDRLQVLLHIKYTVQEFSKPLTKDIIDLIDREADLIGRGRSEDSMEGLRRRLSNLFLQFIKTPEFNPQAARYAKIPMEVLVSRQEYGYTKTTMMKFKPPNDPSLFSMCKYCQRQLPIDAFQYMTGLKSAPRKCKDCHYCENIAMNRLSDDGVERMLKWIRTEEERKMILLDQAWSHMKNLIMATKNSQREQRDLLLQLEGRMKVAMGLFGMNPPVHLPANPATWPASKKLSQLEDDQSFVTLFTMDDVRLLVEKIWGGQSVITLSNSNDSSKRGKQPVVNYDELMLTRWDPMQPLSPWNCVLVNRKESISHDNSSFALAVKRLQADLGLSSSAAATATTTTTTTTTASSIFHKIYSPVFLQRVKTKHIEAKSYFASVVENAGQLRKQFYGSTGETAVMNGKEQEVEDASAKNESSTDAPATVAPAITV